MVDLPAHNTCSGIFKASCNPVHGVRLKAIYNVAQNYLLQDGFCRPTGYSGLPFQIYLFILPEPELSNTN